MREEYMKINDCYKIVKREDEILLTNIEEGDVYMINDVTLAIFETCEQCDDPQTLIDSIFAKFQCSTDNYSKEDLKKFILDLIANGFIADI